MADEDDLGGWGAASTLQHVERLRPQEDVQTYLPPPDINPTAYSKYPLHRLVQAAYEGDLELMETMLNREDPINGYHHDINEHLVDFNALHAAAMNGQLEVVEMLLRARADPHVRQSMPYGRNPKDGETAREMADKWGWDDVVSLLKRAEEQTPKGVYMRYGTGNNAKLWPINQPEGLDPEQERRAKLKHKNFIRPLPNRGDRKFYGELVFGVTHGWDRDGEVIKRPLGYAAGPMQGDVLVQEQAPPKPRRTTVGIVFPGQGSQYVRMMMNVQTNRKVKEMLAVANRILDFDVLQVCLNGPEQLLEQVTYAHPAIYVASMAGVEKLREERSDAVESPGAVAGLSLGEYSALTVAGVFDFETGLQLVKQRAAWIAEASADPPQMMLSVAGIDKARLAELCAEAQQKAGGLCIVSSEFFPKGCTCSGSSAAIEEVKQLADKNGALQTKILAVSGALHTAYMKPAKEKLEAALMAVLPNMRPPRCDVYMNCTGRVLPAGTDPKKIVPLLCDQLTSPVLWETSIRNMIASGITEFYEAGPMKQLKSMMKRIDAEMWNRTTNIEV